jgi:hypothetical protein
MKKYRKLPETGISAILLCAGVLHAGAAKASERIDEHESLERFRVTVAPEFVQVSSPNKADALMGAGLGASFQYGLSNSWAIGAGLRQAVSMDANALFLYTEFDARVTFALTGSLVLKRREISVGGQRVYEFEERSSGGLRIQGTAAQYLFNTSVNVMPFSGVGGAAFYEFPSSSSYNYVAGVRMDGVSNGKQTLYPLQFFAGVAFWF